MLFMFPSSGAFLLDYLHLIKSGKTQGSQNNQSRSLHKVRFPSNNPPKQLGSREMVNEVENFLTGKQVKTERNSIAKNTVPKPPRNRPPIDISQFETHYLPKLDEIINKQTQAMKNPGHNRFVSQFTSPNIENLTGGQPAIVETYKTIKSERERLKKQAVDQIYRQTIAKHQTVLTQSKYGLNHTKTKSFSIDFNQRK